MDCRRRSAVDDDRSRRIRRVVDDDRHQRRWAVDDDDRSRIAFYQAQAKASLDRVDKNLDRIRKNFQSIRRMRMSSATIPASSPSLQSSTSRDRKQFSRIAVVDDYPPLELPLRWRDSPPEYPPLELPLQWRDSPPLQRDPFAADISVVEEERFTEPLSPPDPQLPFDTSRATTQLPPPAANQQHIVHASREKSQICVPRASPTLILPPDSPASSSSLLCSSSTPAGLALCSSATLLPTSDLISMAREDPWLDADFTFASSRDQSRNPGSSHDKSGDSNSLQCDSAPPTAHKKSGPSSRPCETDDDRDQTCNPDSCSSSRDRPTALAAIHTTGPSPPTTLYAPVTNAFPYPTQLPCPDSIMSDDDDSAPQTPVQAHPTIAEGIPQRNAHRQCITPLSLVDNHSHGKSNITAVATASGDESNDGDRVQLLLTKILKLYIGYFNNYKGWIQLEIENPRKLVRLDKTCCGRTDEISSGIGKLENLDAILLQVNGLAREPPPELRQLHSFKSKDLSNNAFTAETPPSFVGLNKHTLLNLFNNKRTLNKHTLLAFGAWSLSSSSDSCENKSRKVGVMDRSELGNFMRNPGFELQDHTYICDDGYHDTASKLMSYNVWSREDIDVIKRMEVIGQLIQDVHKLFGEMHNRDMMCAINRMTLPIDNLSYTEENYPSVCGCRTWNPIFGIKAFAGDLFGELRLIYNIVPNNSLEQLVFDKPESMLNWKHRLYLIKIIALDAPKYLEFMSERNNYGAHQIYLTFPTESTFTNDDVLNYFSPFGPIHDMRIPRQGKWMFSFVSFYHSQTTHVIWTLGYLIPELMRTRMMITSTVSAFGGFLLENMYKRIKIFDPGGLLSPSRQRASTESSSFDARGE